MPRTNAGNKNSLARSKREEWEKVKKKKRRGESHEEGRKSN